MKLALIALGLLLASACVSATAQPGAKSLADAVPEPPADMTISETSGDDILSLIAALYPGWPDGAEGDQTIDIKIGKNENGVYQATIIQPELLDDSVAQTKDTLTFAKDGEWRVTGFRQHRKCYRTGMFEWTAKPCP